MLETSQVSNIELKSSEQCSMDKDLLIIKLGNTMKSGILIENGTQGHSTSKLSGWSLGGIWLWQLSTWGGKEVGMQTGYRSAYNQPLKLGSRTGTCAMATAEASAVSLHMYLFSIPIQRLIVCTPVPCLHSPSPSPQWTVAIVTDASQVHPW